ncbi:MAG: hypothetical protein KBI20_07940 [Sedimentibacter sp.]|nr:hypothetical protein [Sedimentibacter sp.]
MELQLTIEIRRKGDRYLARAQELDFISQGETLEEAKKNLLAGVRIQFEEMEEMGSLEEYLLECGFEIKGDMIRTQS